MIQKGRAEHAPDGESLARNSAKTYSSIPCGSQKFLEFLFEADLLVIFSLSFDVFHRCRPLRNSDRESSGKNAPMKRHLPCFTSMCFPLGSVPPVLRFFVEESFETSGGIS